MPVRQKLQLGTTRRRGARQARVARGCETKVSADCRDMLRTFAQIRRAINAARVPIQGTVTASINEQETDSRQAAVYRWLTRLHGEHSITLEFASDDASFRRYFRATFAGRTAIVMDAPPAREDSRPFVRRAWQFDACGLTTPRIDAIDLTSGFLQLEDFGVTTYFDHGCAGQPMDRPYAQAIDALSTLSRQGQQFADSLDRYDDALVDREIGLFGPWFIEAHLKAPSIDRDPVWQRARAFLLGAFRRMPKTMVHRDYHSRNLMLLVDRSPGVIDFQDAVWGPLAYDLVSLLKDCYVSLPDAQCRQLLDRYAERALLPTDYTRADLERDIEIAGIQRHLKVAGIFARLCHRDGKHRYLDDLPRVIDYLRAALPAFPELAMLVQFLPDTAALTEARKCAR